MQDNENTLLAHTHYFHFNEESVKELKDEYFKHYQLIKTNFCGNVIDYKTLTTLRCAKHTIIYIGSDVEFLYPRLFEMSQFNVIIKVVKELSLNYENDDVKRFCQLVSIGEVPLNIHGVGILFPRFFDMQQNYFERITEEHEFQELTESNKPGNALRKGIYLTHVTKVAKDYPANNPHNDSHNDPHNDQKEHNDQNDQNEQNDVILKFKLLRCSTNFRGPTNNFRSTDIEIINKVNNICKYFFKYPVELNHVLAQIYNNVEKDNKVQRKAAIKNHSDKRKDMKSKGLIAFCTFLKLQSEVKNVKQSADCMFDQCYNNNTSVLTNLRFRLKDCITDTKYVKQFDITLYPNSMFVIALDTNRSYTHEIVPSILDITKIPLRMGYIVRCSDTEAIHKNGLTYIVQGKKLIELKEPNEDNVKELKELYLKENTTDEHIDYHPIFYTMNDGDRMKPLI